MSEKDLNTNLDEMSKLLKETYAISVRMEALRVRKNEALKEKLAAEATAEKCKVEIFNINQEQKSLDKQYSNLVKSGIKLKSKLP